MKTFYLRWFCSVVILMMIGCGPNAEQESLITTIDAEVKTLEDKLIAMDGTLEYLGKEQAEFEDYGKAWRKKLGKPDSLLTVHLKAHAKVVDMLQESTTKAKEIQDEYKSFIEKLNAPVSFTFDVREIKADFALLQEQLKAALEASEPAMPEHKRIEDNLKARLAELEAAFPATTTAKSSATKAQK